MNVPSRLTVMGETQMVYGSEMRGPDRDTIMSKMSVPERLMLNGGGSAGPPKEILFDQFPPDLLRHQQGDLPERLTLADHQFPDVVESVGDEETQTARNGGEIDKMSNSSIAVDENPLQELKLMRRQLLKMNTRMYTMEDEMEKRKQKDLIQIALTIAGFAGVILLSLLRR